VKRQNNTSKCDVKNIELTWFNYPNFLKNPVKKRMFIQENHSSGSRDMDENYQDLG